jgi:hypothetical protein
MSRPTTIARFLCLLATSLVGSGCGQSASQYEVGAEATYGQEQHLKSVQDEEREHFEKVKANAAAQPKRIVGE